MAYLYSTNCPSKPSYCICTAGCNGSCNSSSMTLYIDSSPPSDTSSYITPRVIKKALLRNQDWKNYPGIQLCFRLFGTKNLEFLIWRSHYSSFMEWVNMYFRHHQVNLHLLDSTNRTIPKPEDIKNLYISTLDASKDMNTMEELLGNPDQSQKDIFYQSDSFITLISTFPSEEYNFYHNENDEILVWGNTHRQQFLKVAGESEAFPDMIVLEDEFTKLCFRTDLYSRGIFMDEEPEKEEKK